MILNNPRNALFSKPSSRLRHTFHMRVTGEYRGIEYSIPHNDDGIWHFQVHPKRNKLLAMRGRPQGTAADGYRSREAAIEAARKAIDAWLERPSG
ncbi:MAG: hypothetical protein ACJ8EL_20390 [Rhizomicrobium sp.]